MQQPNLLKNTIRKALKQLNESKPLVETYVPGGNELIGGGGGGGGNTGPKIPIDQRPPGTGGKIRPGYEDEDEGERANEISKKEIIDTAEKLAFKSKEIATAAGTEMVNFAKEVYDTPTAKKLRNFIAAELNKFAEKLVDKLQVDRPGKQIEIPFPEDDPRMDPAIRSDFDDPVMEEDVEEGTCGYSKDGKPRKKPSGPLQESTINRLQKLANIKK
jgi:hypothetical protein